MDGALARLYAAWREKILQSVAHLEAFIDFSEEENLEDGILDSVRDSIIRVRQEIQRHLSDGRRGERLRNGVQVAIIGEPNVGKSSLLNALCQRPAAMVSPIAGTTRDIVETTLNISGYPVIVSDTAGLRHTSDELELEGVRRAVKRSKEVDLLILVVDIANVSTQENLLTDRSTAAQFVNDCLIKFGIVTSPTETDKNGVAEVVLVLNKDDLIPEVKRLELCVAVQGRFGKLNCCLASCCSKTGLDSFLDVLTLKLRNLCGNLSTENPVLSNARHRLHLVNCLKFLNSYVDEHSTDCVLGADDLRRAAHQIGKVAGRVTTEDVLDVIFRDFCIGK